jgi:sugar O-acyltransferase (sialic acid O-acetyltransferase NeuD family)
VSKIIIFGPGNIGELALFYLQRDSSHEVVAFCADGESIGSADAFGLPLIPFEETVDKYSPDDFSMFVALGYRDLNAVREQKYHEAKSKGYELISYVCSRSVMWGDTEIGDNCFIFENQTIQPFVKIGNNVTMWSGNHIGHHSSIGDHCFITSHVVVSGHVAVGDASFLGVNSTLKDGITLAPRTVIGAGATRLKDTVEGGVYIGVAAKLRHKDGKELGYFKETNYQQKTAGE